MKNLILTTLLSLVFLNPVFASGEKAKEQRLDKIKSHVVQHLEKRIITLRQGKSCINAAKSKEALKGCRKEMKSKMATLRKNAKALRQKLKKNRKKS